MTRRKPDRRRPLLDRTRARFVRAALDRKRRERERAVLTGVEDPARHARTRAHLRECLDLLAEDDET